MRRLDPKSILIITLEWLRKAIFPLVITFVANGRAFTDGDRMKRGEMWLIFGMPIIFGLLAIVGGIISYLVMRFGIQGGALIISRKGLWRQERTIPLERIQNVQITQGLLERLLGIATVQVETASGTGAEASLRSLSVADAHEIKHQLLGAHAQAKEVGVDEPPLVYRAEFKDIALAGALQNRALLVTVAILGLFGQSIGDVMKGVIDFFEKSHVGDIANKNPNLAVLVTTIAILLFLLVGWLLSIGYAIVTYYGFKVTKTDRGLQIVYGLIKTVHTVIPIRRIQSIQTNASWLFKLLNLNQLYVQTVGGHTPGSENVVATGQSLIAPICRPPVLRELLHLIDPKINLDRVNFTRPHPVLLVRQIVNLILFYGVLASVVFAILTLVRDIPPLRYVLIGIVALAGLGVLLSVASYRRIAYAKVEDHLIIRRGTLGENLTIIPFGNVQAVTISSDWLLRRFGLVGIDVVTPASTGGIPCIPRSAAEQLRDELVAKSFGKNRRGL